MKKQLVFKINRILDSNNEGLINTYEGLVSKFIVNIGAKEEDIIKCDNYFRNKIPNDYKLFLKNYNGSVFFKIDDFAGYKFFDCNSLITENKFQKENLSDDWDENIILICSCLGDGDYIRMKILNESSYQLLDCFNEKLPYEWNVIGTSFDTFLEKLIDEKGRKFWLD